MANWTYRCYIDGKLPNLWQRWYDSNPQVQGAHDAAFELLEQMEMWAPPKFKNLARDGKGVHEVKMKGRDNLQWRIFGHAFQNEQEFLVTAIGWHKGKQYSPATVIGTAKSRISEVNNDPGKAESCDRPGKQT